MAMGVLEEKYFDYQRILKTDSSFKSFKVPAEPFFQALSAGAAFADKVKFEFNKNKLKLVVTSEQGILETRTSGQGSLNLSIVFNPRFFAEAVEAFQDQEELKLLVKSSTNRCEITAGGGHRHFLMPIHET
jgi:DNA polymerase III sliding clamp (beta) subunit (PCNA family)